MTICSINRAEDLEAGDDEYHKGDASGDAEYELVSKGPEPVQMALSRGTQSVRLGMGESLGAKLLGKSLLRALWLEFAHAHVSEKEDSDGKVR